MNTLRKRKLSIYLLCVLSPTLFLIFINNLLSVTSNPIHSYADDSTLHSSTIFPKASSINTRLSSSLNEDLDRIASWRANNLVNLNRPKNTISVDISVQYWRWSIRHLQKHKTHKAFHILGLTVSSNLSWKPQIAKFASAKLRILFKYHPFFTCEQLLRICKGLIRLVLSTATLNRVESKTFRLNNYCTSPDLASQLPPLKLHRDFASLSLSLSFKSIILAMVRWNLDIVCIKS